MSRTKWVKPWFSPTNHWSFAWNIGCPVDANAVYIHNLKISPVAFLFISQNFIYDGVKNWGNISNIVGECYVNERVFSMFKCSLFEQKYFDSAGRSLRLYRCTN